MKKRFKSKYFHRAISKAINDKKILYSRNVDHDLSEIIGENFNLISKEGELLASIPLEDLKNQAPNGCLLGCIGLPAFLAIISVLIIRSCLVFLINSRFFSNFCIFSASNFQMPLSW